MITEKELIEKEVYKEILSMILDGSPYKDIVPELQDRVEKLEYKNLNIKEDAQSIQKRQN